jgi:hypothetical protein
MLARERAWEAKHERKAVTDEAIDNTEIRQMPWASVALSVVEAAARQERFESGITTDDIWRALDNMHLSRPDEPRAMGAVMRRAVKAGYITPTDRIVQSSRGRTSAGTTHHTAPVRVYRSCLL